MQSVKIQTSQQSVIIRAQLFKTYNVVSYSIIKTLIIKYGIYTYIFAEKNVSSFCICSYSHFFSKNTDESDIILTRTVDILTTNELINDALNNWALIGNFLYIAVFYLSNESVNEQWAFTVHICPEDIFSHRMTHMVKM